MIQNTAGHVIAFPAWRLVRVANSFFLVWGYSAQSFIFRLLPSELVAEGGTLSCPCRIVFVHDLFLHVGLWWQWLVGPNSVLSLSCSSVWATAKGHQQFDFLHELGKTIAFPRPGADRAFVFTEVGITHLSSLAHL